MKNNRQLLRIRTSEGAPQRLLVVCPNDDEPVRLERCLKCSHGEGVEILSPTEAYVRCHSIDAVPRSRSARKVPISEIMTTDVVTVNADSSIETVVWMLLTRGFGGAPVVDGDGGLVGIVTSSDLLRHQIGEETAWGPPVARPDEALTFDPAEMTIRSLSGLTAHDVMTPVVLTLPDDAPVAMAAALMAMERIHRVVVVSRADSDEVVGIVSSLDVLRWVAVDERYVLDETI